MTPQNAMGQALKEVNTPQVIFQEIRRGQLLWEIWTWSVL